jgi:hypothetical protein
MGFRFLEPTQGEKTVSLKSLGKVLEQTAALSSCPIKGKESYPQPIKAYHHSLHISPG